MLKTNNNPSYLKSCLLNNNFWLVSSVARHVWQCVHADCIVINVWDTWFASR